MIVCLFGSTVKPGKEPEDARLSAKLDPILRGMPGFISYKDYEAPDGEAIGLIRFEREEHLRAWVAEGVHGRMQPRAAEIYDTFWIQTAATYREYVWENGRRVDGDLRHLFV